MATKKDMKAHFSVNKVLPAAWDFLWASNLKDRAAGHDYRGQTYYVTATDLERQVRAFAQDSMEGRAWTTPGREYYGGVKIQLNAGPHVTLLDVCRRWLFDQVAAGKLDRNHNNGRGHISGEKFRPAGAPLSPSELRGIEAKEQRAEAPVHMYGQGHKLICRKPSTKPRSLFSRSSGRSKTRKSSNPANVTCKKCMEIMQTPGWVNYWDQFKN